VRLTSKSEGVLAQTAPSQEETGVIKSPLTVPRRLTGFSPRSFCLTKTQVALKSLELREGEQGGCAWRNKASSEISRVTKSDIPIQAKRSRNLQNRSKKARNRPLWFRFSGAVLRPFHSPGTPSSSHSVFTPCITHHADPLKDTHVT